MATKPNVLGNANFSIKKKDQVDQPVPADASQAATVPSPAALAENDPPIGVLFRLNSRDHEIVSDYARDLKMSMQELIETAINRMRRADGLAEITGRPRSKTRRRR